MTFDLETGARCSACHGVYPLPILMIIRLFVFDLWALGATTECQWAGRDVIAIDRSASSNS